MKTAFDIGSHDGKDSIKLLEQGYRVFAFEPMHTMVKHFLPILSKYEHFNFIPTGIDLETGFKPFNVFSTLSSLYNFNKEVSDSWYEEQNIEEKTYTQNTLFITLYDFCTFTNIDKIDYLHCDAQGNDLRVLKSLKSKISIVERGVVESGGQKSLYLSDNLKPNIEQFLIDNGFKIDNIETLRDDQNEFNIHFSKV